jgi:hypothetical protein
VVEARVGPGRWCGVHRDEVAARNSRQVFPLYTRHLSHWQGATVSSVIARIWTFSASVVLLPVPTVCVEYGGFLGRFLGSWCTVEDVDTLRTSTRVHYARGRALVYELFEFLTR